MAYLSIHKIRVLKMLETLLGNVLTFAGDARFYNKRCHALFIATFEIIK